MVLKEGYIPNNHLDMFRIVLEKSKKSELWLYEWVSYNIRTSISLQCPYRSLQFT